MRGSGNRDAAVGGANSRGSAATEKVAAVPISEEDFIGDVRKLTWECLEMLTETRTMEPDARLRFLRRRILNRARSFETLAIADVVDRAALVELIAGVRSISTAGKPLDDEP